jgi:uncharacterized protein involved in outer membrane biogenesis
MKKFALGSVALLLLLPMLMFVLLTLMPMRYLAQSIEMIGSRITGGELHIESVALQVWRRQPVIDVTGMRLLGSGGEKLLATDRLYVSLDVPKLLSRVVLLPELRLTNPTIIIERQADGALNWSSLQTTSEGDGGNAHSSEPPLPERDSKKQQRSRRFVLQIAKLLVTDAEVNYIDQSRDITVELTGSIVSESQNDSPTKVAADGNVNEVPVGLDVQLPSPSALYNVLRDASVLEILSAHLEFADSSLTADGYVALRPTDATDLNISVNLTGTKYLQQIFGIRLPELPPMQIQGGLSKDQGVYVLRRFDGRLAQSDLQGDIRVNPVTSPVTLYANIISTRLDIDDLAGLIGGTPNDSRQNVRRQSNARQSSSIKSSSAKSSSAKSSEQKRTAPKNTEVNSLLPSKPIDLIPLTKLFNGAVEFRADSVRSGSWPVESFDTRVEINGTDVSIPFFKVAIADGRVSGEMKLNAATRPPEIVAKMNVRKVDLRAVMQSLGVDDDSFGILGGEVKLWSNGNSIAEFAANLDGGLFLLMVNGKLDALLTELAGLDVLESLALIIKPGKSLTDIRCAYLDVLAEQGTVDIGTMVLDTVDTLFIADGQLDLADEQLNLTVEPHPKDVSIVASKTSAVISGPLSNLSVAPGTGLTARAAVATSLAALASPLTALLPFVQLGTQSNSHYCSGLIEAMNDQR